LNSKSKKNKEKYVDKAIASINLFKADMGGTELFNAIKEVLNSLEPDICNNIFILTDGDISNSDVVLKMISQKMKPNIRFYGLGIGSDCSQFLLE
jgi:uncharacterized protein with von Willebrand factor type A (vWA) domain